MNVTNKSDTDAKPTPGPWEVYDSVVLPKVRPRGKGWDVAEINVPDGHMSTPVDDIPPEVERTKEANARLIAAAGTAAQEAKEMGYDPQKTVEALPQILSQIESLLQGEFEHEGVIFPIITDLLRELGGEPLEKDALASAEGSGDE